LCPQLKAVGIVLYEVGRALAGVTVQRLYHRGADLTTCFNKGANFHFVLPFGVSRLHQLLATLSW